MSEIGEQHRTETDAEHRAFYELIGHYITRCQSLEDYLADVFSAALTGCERRNRAIFAAVRGIEVKLAVIDAVLSEREQHTRQHWKLLRRSIANAHETRGDLAHSRPVSSGRTTIMVNPVDKSTRVIHSENWTETRKQTRTGERVWRLADLKRELTTLDSAWRALLAFTKMLHGEKPPDHLMTALRALIDSDSK